MAHRPFSNTSAFKRIVLDMKTEEAIAYDEALAVEMQQRPGLTRSAHIRELIVSFTQAKKGSKRGKV